MRIILTGPRAVGKTTVGKILAKKLKKKFIDFDDFADDYYKDYGTFTKYVNEQAKSKGILPAWKIYWKESEKIVEKLFKEDNFVCAFASSVFAQPLIRNASNAKFVHDKAIIIGLYPEEDTFKGVEKLLKREMQRKSFKGISKAEKRAAVLRDYKSVLPKMNKYAHIKIICSGKIPQMIAEETASKLKPFLCK